MYSRKNQIAIDTLIFRTEVRPFYKDDIQLVPENGVNIHGLYIEGCRWDVDLMALEDSDPKVLFSDMPVIWYKFIN